MKIKSIKKVNSDCTIKFYDVVNVFPNHNFLVCCDNCTNVNNDKSTFIVQHNCAMMDEVDFKQGGIKGTSALDAQNSIMAAYRTIKARIVSRFTKNNVLYGRLFLISSKKSEHDFLEAYVNKMKNDKMLVVDEPQWVIKPKGTFDSRTFPVAVGNRSLKSMVLPDETTEEEKQAYIKQGYRILEVPFNFKPNFKLDINTALMDLAGISVTGAVSFFNFDLFSKCYVKDYTNPFITDIITTGINDDLQISNFFELDKVPVAVKSMPQFIHIDASLTGDKTGISSVGVSGVKETMQYNGANEILSQELTYKHIFSVDIQAPQGSEISFEKIRQFIYFLKASGFNIKGISTDGFQSADMRQLLSAQGYDASLISLDKTPQGYLTLRSAMNDGRIALIQIDLLETELIQLQRDVQTGKIDHPVDGCFTGDTLIRLSDGTEKQIIDLINKENIYTFGYKDGKIVTAKIKKVFLTKYVNTLIKITLNNSITIRCTENHLFMLSNGVYKEAKNLTINDILKGTDKLIYITNLEIINFSDPIAVYDMEVPDTHNFLLGAGIFVHNSKDMSDSLAGALWNATLHKTALIDSLDLLSSAVEVNEVVDPQTAFISDLQESMQSRISKPTDSMIDELLSNFMDSDIISW